MARRSDHTRPELEELAISTGWEMLSAEGLTAFSARKLATAIGYSVGTVTHLFGGYDELILRLNARTLDQWYAQLEQELATYRGKEPIAQLARAYLAYSRSHTHRWQALFMHQLPADKALPDWYAQKMQRFFTLTESLLTEIIPQKRRAEQAARVLWAGIHGIAMLGLTDKLNITGAASAETLAQELVKTYINGMQRA